MTKKNYRLKKIKKLCNIQRTNRHKIEKVILSVISSFFVKNYPEDISLHVHSKLNLIYHDFISINGYFHTKQREQS